MCKSPLQRSMNMSRVIKIIVIVLVLNGYTLSNGLSQTALEEIIKNTIALGDDKKTVMQAFEKMGVTKQSYERLKFELENGEIRPSLRQYLGKEIPLTGKYRPASKPWENTRYGLIAIFKGRDSEMHVRCSFDKQEKLIACYIRKHVDAM